MNESRQNTGKEDTSIREPRVVPEPIDEGKEVVGTDYHHVGMVSGVEGNTLYVAPNTSLPERIRRKLDWDDGRETDHPLSSQYIEEIDDEVVITARLRQERRADDDEQ